MSFETQVTAPLVKGDARQRVILKSLIKETIDGIPFYYKGNREVLNKIETKTDIMADSGLQGYIKTFLDLLLGKHLDLSKYHVFYR